MTLRRKHPLGPGKTRRPAKGSGGLRSRKPIAKRNPKRKAKEFARAYGSDERVEFVRWLPCLLCARMPSQNAHVGNGGMSRKADADRIVPLCGPDVTGCHAIYDDWRGSQRSFEEAYASELSGRTMLECAADVEAAWQRWNDESGLTPLSSIVPRVLAELMEDEA